MEASITLKKVARKFRDNAILADLSFGVERGSRFAIIGENGAGKSTMLKILTGLLERDAGMAYINGQEIQSRGRTTRSMTGYMPQKCHLDSELTVLENLTIFAQLHGLPRKSARRQALRWAILLGFRDYLGSYPHKLSFGHSRRVSFARALIHNPDVILLDEPTTGLDPVSRTLVWNTLDKFKDKKTVLFTSQNFSEVEEHASRIAILHDGNIKMDGSLDRLTETTQGLMRYSITFSDIPDRELIQKIKAGTRVVSPSLSGKKLEFYSRERQQFFAALRIAMEMELDNIDTSYCRLRDIFLGLTEGGLE